VRAVPRSPRARGAAIDPAAWTKARVGSTTGDGRMALETQPPTTLSPLMAGDAAGLRPYLDLLREHTAVANSTSRGRRSGGAGMGRVLIDAWNVGADGKNLRAHPETRAKRRGARHLFGKCDMLRKMATLGGLGLAARWRQGPRWPCFRASVAALGPRNVSARGEGASD
jgi:hypothetical protein